MQRLTDYLMKRINNMDNRDIKHWYDKYWFEDDHMTFSIRLFKLVYANCFDILRRKDK
jgi:hypothetical protein